MTIEGRIAIDIGFTDTYTASSVTNVQRISLTQTDAYTAGKVAVISGTCGTAGVAVTLDPTSYRDASGSLVSFSAVSRVAFQSSLPCTYEDDDNSIVGITFGVWDENGLADSVIISRSAASGTASYTIVIYGT